MAGVPAVPSVGELIRLLAGHREALLQQGPGAAEEIEMCSRRLEEALAGFAEATSDSLDSFRSDVAGGLPVLPRPLPAELAWLQDEIQATQATLSRLAAGNRRALDTLFGEASLYSR